MCSETRRDLKEPSVFFFNYRLFSREYTSYWEKQDSDHWHQPLTLMDRSILSTLPLGQTGILTLPDLTYFVFLETWGGAISAPYFLRVEMQVDNFCLNFSKQLMKRVCWPIFQFSWLQHHFYSFYGLLKNFRFLDISGRSRYPPRNSL